MSEWILYGTLGCHLCDKAEAIIQQLQQQFTINMIQVDIASDAQLVESLGERIPVLENCATGERLYWPFDPEILTNWLSSS